MLSEPGAGEGHPRLSLNDLIEFARQENWEEVDRNIDVLCNEPEAVAWVLDKGLENEDGNIRDLAASILEKSGHKLTEEDSAKLKNRLDDDNPYAAFRAAFALFKYGNRSAEIVEKIKEAREDKDVAEIADRYLAELGV